MDVKMPLMLRDIENNGSFAEFGKRVFSGRTWILQRNAAFMRQRARVIECPAG